MNRDRDGVQTRDLAFEGMLLPPGMGVCQVCAANHVPGEPHDRESLYYQYSFYQGNFRWPTWADAMAHCLPEVQHAWMEQLRAYGVPEEQIIKADVA